MQKQLSCFVLGVAVILTFAACAQTGRSVNRNDVTVQSFNEVLGKVWMLDELVSEDSATIINRRKLEADGMGDAFTLIADAERISGKGAPNRYFSPYTLGPDQEISIRPIAGTLMMSIVDPEDIQEWEYYNYLEQVNQWLLTGDKLELYSETPEGEPVILVFIRKEAKTDVD